MTLTPTQSFSPSFIVLSFLLSFAAQLVSAEKPPVPPNARVVLSSDQHEYFLGENVLVHFKLENTGGESFEAEFGGDYRGAARALRYQVTVTDENLNELADPYPSQNCFGGLGGPIDVTPDKPFHQSLPIIRYARFDKPGTYKISISHDFGWKAPTKDAYPAGEITLRFKRPTEEDATQLAKKWLAADKYEGTTYSKKSKPHSDFSQIRFGEYLPALIQPAKEGNKNALIGIGSIRTPNATKVLIDIVKKIAATKSEANPDTLDGFDGFDGFEKEACSQLCMRLPDPYLNGELGKRNVFEDGMKEPRRWLVEHSWQSEFAADILNIAEAFLESTDEKTVATGAYMLECVGSKAQAEQLIAALDREVEKTRGRKLRTDIYPRPRGACMELQRATAILLKRGVTAPENPQSSGECILFATELKQNENFRPADWMKTSDRLLQSQVPFVQEQMLKSLPVPMPEELRPRLAAILKSGDIDASIAACNIVGHDKLMEYKLPILNILGSANEDRLFDAADSAAIALDANYERIEILVSRLDEKERVFKCLNSLKSIFSNSTGGGWNSNIDVQAEARRIKPLWETFVADHQDDLRAGKKFELPHPDISAEMFPQQYTINLRSAGEWPKRE